MTISGQDPPGVDAAPGSGEVFHAVNPATGERLEPPFREATTADVAGAVERAEVAFRAYRRVAAAARAHFLRAIGDEILALVSELIERGHAETSLPVARLENVRGSTVNQLRPSGGG